MAGLALVALIAAGWRQNARATRRPPVREPLVRRPWEPIGIAETTVPLYKRPGLLKRAWAAIAGLGLAVVIGAVAATITAFGSAYVVITLTDMLKH